MIVETNSTAAHASYATTGVKQIRQQESSYRQNRLRDIKANSNLSLCVLGKQNVRCRLWFVFCVHHLSLGPYHGPCHARSAGGGQVGRSTEQNLSVVEVKTKHWWSVGDKCPHALQQVEPPCNRCRVPVRFVAQISGVARFCKGDEFLIGYRSLSNPEDSKRALASDKFKDLQLRSKSTYSPWQFRILPRHRRVRRKPYLLGSA